MSHLKEREERNCLNCNAQIQGKYCHICGQENISARESVWHLVSHFFEDITHFDGKFFRTLGLLIRKPGFLSRKYMEGRRAGYLNPVRMYVFSSAFFFLIFFSFFNVDNFKINANAININGKSMEKIEAMDSVNFAEFTRAINKNRGVDKPMSRVEFKVLTDSVATVIKSRSSGKMQYKTRSSYDSALSAGKEKDNWWVRQIIYKTIEINSKYGNDKGEFWSEIAKSILHRLPQLLFISLPLFALLLKLLYIRRKKFFYVDHAVFSIHLYIFLFISILVLFGLSKLNEWLGWGFLNILYGLLVASIFFYLYKAMRNFYDQRRAKSILKFLLLILFSFLLLVLLFMVLIFFSFFTI